MGLFAQDTFAGTAGADLNSRAGELGATWSRHPSAPGAILLSAAGRAYRSPGSYSPAVYLASGAPASAGYSVSAVVRFLSLGSDEYDGLVGRWDPTANTGYYVVYESNSGRQLWRLSRRVAGTPTSLGTYSHTPTVGVDYQIRLEITDAAKTLILDGSPVISSSDNTITGAGRAGLFAVGGTAGNGSNLMHFDTFEAADLAPAVNLPAILHHLRMQGRC